MISQIVFHTVTKVHIHISNIPVSAGGLYSRAKDHLRSQVALPLYSLHLREARFGHPGVSTYMEFREKSVAKNSSLKSCLGDFPQKSAYLLPMT